MKYRYLLPAVLVCITAFSCTTYRYIYAASPANDPYFTKKGESRVAGYYSGSKGAAANVYAEGADIQGAYSVSNHFAVTAGFFGRREKDIFSLSTYNTPFDSSSVRYKRRLTDIGAGYFITLGREKIIAFSFYTGYAGGKFSIDDRGLLENPSGSDTAYTRFQNINISKFYFQPAFNLMPSDYFHCAFILKVSYVHYGNTQTNYTADETSYFGFDRLRNKTYGIVEPSFNIDGGAPQIPWLRLTGSISLATNPMSDNTTLRVRGGCFSIGLAFDPTKIKRKTAK